MRGVRVSLSSGEAFYVDAELDEVALVLNSAHLTEIGGRRVNGSQVTQLVSVEVPSIEVAERLEQEEAVA